MVLCHDLEYQTICKNKLIMFLLLKLYILLNYTQRIEENSLPPRDRTYVHRCVRTLTPHQTSYSYMYVYLRKTAWLKLAKTSHYLLF